MTNTVTNILSHDEELALRKPIEDYVGKIQAEIDELREEGTNKVLEYSEEIEVLKRDKIYTKSEKEARISELNGKLQKASYKVQIGDEISINVPEAKETNLKSQDIPIDIIYEDNDILVVNKPKGMVVHPAAGNPDGTLVNAVMAHCKGNLSGIGGELRPRNCT